ncbi:MAG: hypothetical protein HW403_1312 [Dehalococcoidia bacterium]|nr:hypothetical protein [Dehalococcoidia bacterium]
MAWRTALAHPLSLGLLFASLLMAGTVNEVAPWSGQAIWMVLWGLLAYGSSVMVVVLRSQPRANTLTDSVSVAPSEDVTRITVEALRRLNDLAFLSQCELTRRIPHTVEATRARIDGTAPEEATPLGRAKALSEVLLNAIQRLAPAREDDISSAAALVYHILHEEYVLRRSTASIMTRHNISERTFYRHSDTGRKAVTQELWAREQQLSHEKTRGR